MVVFNLMTHARFQMIRMIALLCGLTGTAGQAQDLSASDLRQAAQLMLDDGQIANATGVSDALLANDPNDVVALIIRAQTALATGASADAVGFAARAYRAAGNDGVRYVAARLTARAHADQQQDTRAQLWLRRARQFAPDAAASASVGEDYAFVSDRNPLALSFSFGVSPTNNVNNGITSETTDLVFLGLPFEYTPGPDERALSGVAYSLGINARYRASEARNFATFYDFNASGVTYTLSQDAKSKAPDVKGSDNSSANLSFGVIHQRIFREGALPTTFSFRVGQTWSEGDLDRRYVEVGTAQSYRVGDTGQISVSLNAQKSIGRGNIEPVRSYSIGTSYGHGFSNGNYGSVFASYRISASDNNENDYDSKRVGARFDLAVPINTVQFGFGADFEQREYDFSFFAGGPRMDDTVTANATAAFTAIEYYGFQPVATVKASRTSSTVGFYEREYINLSFDLRSTF